MQVGDELKMAGPDRIELEFVALLHDVGKIAIDNEIINRRGPLTQDEFTVIKTHTIEGHHMLEEVGGLLGRVGAIVRPATSAGTGGLSRRVGRRGHPPGRAGRVLL